MGKRWVIGGLVVAGLLGAIVWWGIRDAQGPDMSPLADAGMVFYWGDGCSHCANVDAFLKDKQIDTRVSFERKEVWNDAANRKEMGQRAQQCGISLRDVGVPFLVSDGACFIGEPDVKKEFERIAEQNTTP